MTPISTRSAPATTATTTRASRDRRGATRGYHLSLAADAEDAAIIEGYAALDPRVEGIPAPPPNACKRPSAPPKRWRRHESSAPDARPLVTHEPKCYTAIRDERPELFVASAAQTPRRSRTACIAMQGVVEPDLGAGEGLG